MKTAAPRVKRQVRGSLCRQALEGSGGGAYADRRRGGRAATRPARTGTGTLPRAWRRGEGDAVAELEAVIGSSDEDDDEPAEKREAEEPSNFLAMYFKDMARLAVLRPQEEFESARKLESLEIALWVRVLSLRAGDRPRAQGLRAHAGELDHRVQVRAQASADAEEASHQGRAGALRAHGAQDLGEAARARHRQAHPRHRPRRHPQGRARHARARHRRRRRLQPEVARLQEVPVGRRDVVRARAGRQERVRQGEPAAGGVDRAALQLRAHAAGRSHPGGQHRPHQGGGALRLPSRLSLLDLCVVVDSPRHLARAGRQGARGAPAGAHDRRLPPRRQEQARAVGQAGAAADVGGAGRGHRHRGAQDREDAHLPARSVVLARPHGLRRGWAQVHRLHPGPERREPHHGGRAGRRRDDDRGARAARVRSSRSRPTSCASASGSTPTRS